MPNVYEEAMKITEQDYADEFMQRLVEMRVQKGEDRDIAEREERATIGWYGGNYLPDVRKRIERLFNCEHPIFGKVEELGHPKPEESYELGMRIAKGEHITLKELREKRNGTGSHAKPS